MSGYNTGFTFNSGASAPSLTATEVGFGSAGNTLTSAATLTYNSTTGVLTSSLGDALLHTITVGLGNSAVATNTALGRSALAANTTGSNNVGVGYDALLGVTTGSSNVGIGYLSLATTTTGSSNVSIGASALQNNFFGSNNTALGTSALSRITTSGNVGIGANSATNSTTGTGIVAVGTGSLQSNTTGSSNVAVGNSSLTSNLTGSNNVAVGSSALTAATGTSNTALGGFAGQALTTGNNNTFVGYGAANASTGTTGNTFIGASSGSQVLTGGQNSILGTYTGAAAPISNSGSRFVVLSDGTGQVDAYWDSAKTLFLQGAVSATGSVGTLGQVLTSAGAGVPPTWSTVASGSLTITNTITNANYYVGFQASTSGTTTADYVNTAFTFNPQPGILQSPYFTSIATGEVFTQLSTNANALNSVHITNLAANAGAGASYILTNDSGNATLQLNATNYNASPTTFSQVNKSLNLTNTVGTINLQSTFGINFVYNNGLNAYTINNAGALLLGSGPTAAGSAGTSGQVLTSQGAGAAPIWTTVAAGSLTLANAATNAAYYPTFSSAATGAVTTEYTNTRLNFNPATGALTTDSFAATNVGGYGFSQTASFAGQDGLSVTNTSGLGGASAGISLSNASAGGNSVFLKINGTAFTATPANFSQVNNAAVLTHQISGAQINIGSSTTGSINLTYSSGAKAHTINDSGALLLASTPTVTGSAGTVGQVLTSAGASAPPTWTTVGGGGLTLAVDTTTPTPQPVPFAAATTGAITTEYTNPALTFSPTTGILRASGFTATAIINTSGTGTAISLNSSNPGAVNNINATNTDSGAGSAAAISITAGGAGAATFGKNSVAFNASPTLFTQVNSMAYINAGSAPFTIASQGGINFTYTLTSNLAHTINTSGALLLASSPTVPGNAGTSGQVLTSAGSAAPPTWANVLTSFSGGTTGLTPASVTSGAVTLGGTLAIANGGTNGTATPTSGAVAYGTGSAYAFTAAGTAGQVLTSNGAGIPTWTNAGSAPSLLSTQIAFGSGANTITSTLSFTYNSATGVLTSTQGDAVIHGVTMGLGAGAQVSNVVMGTSALQSNTTGTGNTAIGNQALATNTIGTNNTVVGSRALPSASSTSNNTAIGYNALLGITSGVGNTALGASSGSSVASGSYNTVIGTYTGASAPISASGTNWIVLSDGQANVPVYWNGTTKAMYVNASAGTAGQVLTSAGTAATPTWSNAVTSFSAGTTGLTPNTATSGAVTLGGTLAIANGGTNGTATPTSGAVPYGTGTAYAFTAAGTAGQVLSSNGASPPSWITIKNPTFRAYAAVAQTITSGTQQKVNFGTVSFDTNTNYSTSTSRFTPTVAGYYQFNATVRFDGSSGTGEYMIVLYKNGAEYARGSNGSGTVVGSSFWSMSVSDIAAANGSTDYFEVFVQQGSGVSLNTTGSGTAITHFSGAYLRAL